MEGEGRGREEKGGDVWYSLLGTCDVAERKGEGLSSPNVYVFWGVRERRRERDRGRDGEKVEGDEGKERGEGMKSACVQSFNIQLPTILV